MKKESILSTATAILLLICSLPPIAMTTGPIQPPVAADTLYVGRDGWGPRYADPIRVDDEQSQELIFNAYDTLIIFGAPVTNSWRMWDVHEQYWDFSPSLATNVPIWQEVVADFHGLASIPPAGDPTGIPLEILPPDASEYVICGWVDNNPDGMLGQCDVIYISERLAGVEVTCRAWHVLSFNQSINVLHLHRFYYDFSIRMDDGHGNPISFVDNLGNVVDTFDIYDAEYSFKRGLVQDQVGSPMWKFYKPFFDQMSSDWWDTGNPADAYCLSWLINDTVEVLPGNVLRINVGVAFPDAAFKQILCGTWASIVSKEWCIEKGCWNGDLFTDGDSDGYPNWWTQWRHVPLSPIQAVDPLNYAGTGPYRVTVVDSVSNLVVLQRNALYWKGWPATERKSYLEYIDIEYVTDWTSRENAFIAGMLDICEVPRVYMSQLLDAYGEQKYPEIKTIKNIVPFLSLDAVIFKFTVDPASSHIGFGQFPDGIPTDFFNNTHVRKAFAYAWNHSDYLRNVWKDEAVCRETPDIVGLVPDYYTKSPDPPYTYDISVANVVSELQQAMFTQGVETKSVWDWGGFRLDIFYSTGNDERRLAAENIKATFDMINVQYGKLFFVNGLALDSPTLLSQFEDCMLPLCVMGYHCNYADADDFKRSFMHSYGDFSYFQNYTTVNGWNTLGPRTGMSKDQLIDLAVKTPDGPQRANMYADLDDIYITDCPSFPIVQPSGRRWCQSWVRGWYYNALYPSDYYYHLYKENTPWADVTGPKTGIPDGIVNIMDLFYVGEHYGARAPDPGQVPPRQIYDERWAPGTYGCGGCDVHGDRKIDMRDTTYEASHFFEGFPQEQEHGGSVDLVAETSKPTVAIDRTVTVAVKVKSVTNFAGYETCLIYNGSLLELVSWRTEPIPGWELNTARATQKVFGGESCVLVDCAKNIGSGSAFSGSATLVTFVFKGLAEGTATLGISRSTLAAGDPMQGILYNPINGTVSVARDVHDIAIDNIESAKKVVGKGYCANMSVALTNLGSLTETFNVTVYANTTIVANLTDITLSSGNSATIAFLWNTTYFAKGSYTIWAYAWPVADEIDLTDNNRTLADGAISIGVPCDVVGPPGYTGPPDGECNNRDIGYFCTKFGTTPTSPNWDSNCDVIGPPPGWPDNTVNMRDLGEACNNFGNTDP